LVPAVIQELIIEQVFNLLHIENLIALQQFAKTEHTVTAKTEGAPARITEGLKNG
jgi:hypothetical protein